MGKRSTKWSYKTYLRFLRNGRGVGDLACYKPWITIHDFPSKGKVVRILGKKTNRIHHLLSQLEKTYFLILDNDLFVEDIKELADIRISRNKKIIGPIPISDEGSGREE